MVSRTQLRILAQHWLNNLQGEGYALTTAACLFEVKHEPMELNAHLGFTVSALEMLYVCSGEIQPYIFTIISTIHVRNTA